MGVVGHDHLQILAKMLKLCLSQIVCKLCSHNFLKPSQWLTAGISFVITNRWIIKPVQLDLLFQGPD